MYLGHGITLGQFGGLLSVEQREGPHLASGRLGSMAPDPLAVWSLVVSILTFLLGTVVSVVLYRLGRRLDFRSRMRRAEELRGRVGDVFAKQRGELPEVLIVNAKRYEKDYDGGNNANRYGFIMTKGEMLGARHNGVEFITRERDSVLETWIDRRGRRTLRQPRNEAQGWTRASNVMKVGLVPWEYIEHINLAGDDYHAGVIFYVKYKGPGKSPYRSYTFVEGDARSFGPSGRLYFDPVDELGQEQPNRLVALARYQQDRRAHEAMDRAARKKWKGLGQTYP